MVLSLPDHKGHFPRPTEILWRKTGSKHHDGAKNRKPVNITSQQSRPVQSRHLWEKDGPVEGPAVWKRAMKPSGGIYTTLAELLAACWGRCQGPMLALLLGLIENSYASAPGPAAKARSMPFSLDCQYSSVDGAQCSTPSTGPALNIDLSLISANGEPKKLKRLTSDAAGGATWGSESGCAAINTRIITERGLVRIEGHHDCPSPVRMCVAIQTLATASFRSLPGVIEFKDLAFSIQGDSRLGTHFDPQRRTVKLCSDPRGQKVSDWAIDLRSGTLDEIRDALQGAQAPLLDAAGKVIGYSKKSPVVKDGYFFVDLTEKNATELLPLIQQTGFPYTLVYASTWASSKGSYQFNRAAYPGGLAGLKRVVNAANASGIKVGLHTLTGFVSKDDPYVRGGVPDGRLLQDDHSSLLSAIDAKATTIQATDSLATFPTQPAFYGDKAGLDIRIENEIISCPKVVVAERGRFMDCNRGLYGTNAVGHAAGAPIAHLAERHGSYLADLGSTLKEEIAARLAEVINQAGIDMVYFDGGELGSASGDPDWYVAEQQIEVLKRVRRPLLVEGSGAVPRLWPFLTRLVTDDFAALAPVTHLDVHKIGKVYKSHVNNLMPSNLGWLGLLKETPSYPATTPEEISTYVARSLALDVPTAIETRYDDLLSNPYTGRLVNILRAGNQTIRAGVLPGKNRDLLSEGRWYYTDTAGPTLWRLRLSRTMTGNGLSPPEPASARSDERQVFLRIRNVRATTLEADGAIPLVDDRRPVKIVAELPINDANRGELVETVPLSPAAAVAKGGSLVDFVDSSAKSGGLDLHLARQMLVNFDYAAPAGNDADKSGGRCAVLNLQLQDNRGQYRDYLLPLSATGRQQAVLDYETSAPVMLREYLPVRKSYPFKAAVYSFNFSAVTKLNIRRMSSCAQGGSVRLMRVALLKERAGSLRDVRLRVGNKLFPVIAKIGTGETLDVYPDGKLTLCTGAACDAKTVIWPSGAMLSGQEVRVDYEGDAGAEITLGFLGDSVAIGANTANKRP